MYETGLDKSFYENGSYDNQSWPPIAKSQSSNSLWRVTLPNSFYRSEFENSPALAWNVFKSLKMSDFNDTSQNAEIRKEVFKHWIHT